MTPQGLTTVYERLLTEYGRQHWWPAEERFEILVGAVLTQNTSWTQVEKAIATLRSVRCLTPEALLARTAVELGELIRPAGYYNVKARRLQALCHWFVESGGFAALESCPTESLRRGLLQVHGVGPETADSILLYAFSRAVFVIDAYTQRLFSRLGLIAGPMPYEALRAAVESHWPAGGSVDQYGEYHALIVAHAKHICRPRPHCSSCVLAHQCRHARANSVS
ncbi:MAG: endonuclease III domain-containing protein [Pseudomonadota bacterium]|nr:endonuclease III domain-containing protein [Pseudomonadota bacterium]